VINKINEDGKHLYVIQRPICYRRRRISVFRFKCQWGHPFHTFTDVFKSTFSDIKLYTERNLVHKLSVILDIYFLVT